MRLLIIEDDRDAADYLLKAFREVGHVADLAFDVNLLYSLKHAGCRVLEARAAVCAYLDRQLHGIKWQAMRMPSVYRKPRCWWQNSQWTQLFFWPRTHPVCTRGIVARRGRGSGSSYAPRPIPVYV